MGNFTSLHSDSNPLQPLDPLETPLPYTQTKHMLLKLHICDSLDLKMKYQDHVDQHNKSIQSQFFDSGFDLFNPRSYSIGKDENVIKYDLQIRAAAFDSVTGKPMPFYVYPRSSIYKTPLRLANSVGIIDAGYRGNLCALFDKKNDTSLYNINSGARLLQICAPDLRRIHVQLVESPDELGSTERGEGGFGSTGGNN